MKRRVQIDVSLVGVAIILTIIFWRLPQAYFTNELCDNIFDFLGLFLILEGTMSRMAARGHKKKFSEQSKQLVTTGPYRLVRNPMYLGSFLIGLGFAFIVWPWWIIPLFVWTFLWRFNKQISKEEDFLSKTFGQEYETYCQNVPPLFPALQNLNFDPRELINKQELLSTKEKFGLIAWPLLAVVFETLQETAIFKISDLRQTIVIFLSAILVYAIGFIIMSKTIEMD